MKRVTKRLISIILVIVMCMQVLPLSAMAALIDNDPEYNKEILNALTEIVGSEDEAERYYALLNHYGLLDEDGNLSESWEIWMDGKQVTLDDIIAELEKPDCNLDKYVLVDGTAVTLGNIKTILEIEEYIAYLQETYFDGHQWTAEQQASLQSLLEQIEKEGIRITYASSTGQADTVWPSGVSHDARVAVGVYPVITAEGDNTTNDLQSPDKMFDGRRDTKWYSTKGQGNEFVQNFPLSVQIELAEAITVGSYGIVTGDDRPERDPYIWTLYGSNNGTEWTALDAQNEYTFTVGRSEEQTFTLAEPGSYRYFRIQIDARKGGEDISGYGVQISELNFYDAAGARFATEQTRFGAKLTGALAGQTVTFDWEALPGSQPVAAVDEANGVNCGTITMTADENGEASAAFDVTLDAVTTDTVRSSAGLVYYIKCDNLTNALFLNDRSAVSVLGTAAPTLDVMPEVTDENNYVHRGVPLHNDAPQESIVTIPAQLQQFINWGLVDMITVTTHSAENNDGQETLYGNSTDRDNFAILVAAPVGTEDWATFGWASSEENEEGELCIHTWCAWLGGDAYGYNEEIAIRSYEMSYYAEINGVRRAGASRQQVNSETDFSTIKFVNDNYVGRYERISKYFTFSKTLPERIAIDDISGPITTITMGGAYTPTGQINLRLSSNYWTVRSVDYDSVTDSEWVKPGSIIPSAPNVKTIFTNEQPPRVEDVSAPATSHYPGQTVPVTVTFNEPVNAATATVTFNNGTTVNAIESSGYSNVLTFPYEVPEPIVPEITVTHFYAEDTAGNYPTTVGTDEGGAPVIEPKGTVDPDIGLVNGTGSGVEFPIPKTEAINSIFTSVSNPVTNPVLNVDVRIVNNADLANWLVTDLELNPDEANTFIPRSLKVRVDGIPYTLICRSENITNQALTATIPLSLNATGDFRDIIIELEIDGNVVIDANAGTDSNKYFKVAPQPPAEFIEESELTASLMVTDADGNPYEYALVDGKQLIYAQDAPKITAAIGLPAGGIFSFGDTTKVTTYRYDEESSAYTDELEDAAAHFVWKSSDPTVARISVNTTSTNTEVTVVPTGKAGTASISLTALNGGAEGRAVTVIAEYLIDETPHTEFNFGVGLTPYLSIASRSISAVAGTPLTMFWASNIIDKNGNTPTVFSIELKNGVEVVLNDTLTNTSSFTIPGEKLAYHYGEGATNTYTFTVSTTYSGVEYNATAEILLESSPAVVTLNKLNTYYITDTAGAVNIGWQIRNFDRFSSDDELFKFEITRDGELVYSTNDPGEGEGEFVGSYALNPVDVVAGDDPAGFRDIYTVTIQAKNGSDSTWSYDSFMLYVYDADALKIWVDGEAKDSITMSNTAKISQMTQEQILALKRDIYLKNIISINYGEYAWTEVADQIAWASGDNSVATVNYQQGTLYENIENFTYESYRPTTELGLSGIIDGSTTVTATHKLAGMTETLNINVETLKDKLYLFQCYPQATTTLTYTNGNGETRTVTSDATGAAAVYEESGITSDVYCSAEIGEFTYLGTFYLDNLKTGEGDWTKLARYPVNSLDLRRAAYAYLYIKNPDGTPYTGDIVFRGGIYVDDEYVETGFFALNGDILTDNPGNIDNRVTLGQDGKLTVTMDQTQWGLEGGRVSAQDDVSYVFEIRANDTLYPMLITVDANVNTDAFVGTGEAIVSFRNNAANGEQPFIIEQSVMYEAYNKTANMLGNTGNVGPGDNAPEVSLASSVMWWGEDMTGLEPKITLVTEGGLVVAAEKNQHEISSSAYPFTSAPITKYTVKLNAETMQSVQLEPGNGVDLYLDYYRDGEKLSRHEPLTFRLFNLLGMGNVENASSLTDMLTDLGKFSSVNTSGISSMNFADKFVMVAMNLAASDDYNSDSKFNLRIVPTSDPTKFLGLITAQVGNIRDDQQVTGIYAPTSSTGDQDGDYMPGLSELMVATGKRSFSSYFGDDYNRVQNRQGVRNLKMQLGGYAESLIYFDTGGWKIQILDGGFNVGAGMTYSWNYNTMAGPIPFTATLTIGGNFEVMMDALSVTYYDVRMDETEIGTDFLTELRIYLFLHFFAGVGIDYAVVAFKLGIYGQISLDMRFRWLNRPYMNQFSDIINVADGSRNTGNLNGQSFKIDGQIGLQFVARILFISFEKILFSYSFNLLNKTTGDWDKIETNWTKNQEALQSAISTLLGNGSMTASNVGGMQMLSLNLAPTIEDRDYLANGSFWNDGSFGTFALDPTSALKDLQYNSHPYANPVVTDDGAVVAYLSDMSSTSVDDTRASFAVRNEYGMYDEGRPIYNGEGYGDSQIAIAGTQSFAAAAWTRQTETVAKDAGALLTAEDQMIMMDSSEIYAALYNGSSWVTTRLTDNGSADLAPAVAVNDSRAIVAWRAVETSGKENNEGYADITNFDEKDTILYRIYDGTAWSQTYTLYNGTSGAVKGITAAMLNDGTAAVAYTLDTDGDGSTAADREIYFAVVDNTPEAAVTRNVRATNDANIDENPQLAAVTFPSAANAQRFVLGWYTEQPVSAPVTVANGASPDGETLADIRLLDFDREGNYTQLLPDSISQAADAYDVSITPNFHFTKNVQSISDLSIIWAERTIGTATALEGDSYSSEPDTDDTDLADLITENDVLKGVKFYTYGQHDELVSFTGAIDVAEMPDSTLIDHFDAYVSDAANNEIKAVILGSTYGADGIVTKIGTTVGGDTVQYSVPSRTTSMYTATETYQDKIEVPAVLADYETIRKGAKTEILFTVDNNGIHAINALEITLRDSYGQVYTTIRDDLNLLPGSSIQLYADYTVPIDRVVDLDYTVRAAFNEGAGASGKAETLALVAEGRRIVTQDLTQATGKVYLDFPDLEITDASIIREENGERTILVKLNNASDADLAGSDRWVSIGFYSDATCETPITSLAPIAITDNADLAMIDEGGYSTSAVLNVKDHLENVSDKDNPITEIPESGIRIYIKADILEKVVVDTGEITQISPEVITSNNTSSVVCENLKVRTGKDAIVTSTLTNDDTGSTVTVNVQNTRLSETYTGNIIVTLLDADGNVLGQQQSYTGTDGLITLTGEQKVTETFTFDGNEYKNAYTADVVYSDLILGANNANLVSLSFSKFPGISLDTFTEDANNSGVYRASVSSDDLTSTAVMAVAESNLARIKLSDTDEGSNAVSQTVALQPGKVQDITITVTNGTDTKTYILTVQNNGEPIINDPTGTPGSDEPTQYSASTFYAADAAIISLHAAASPEFGYALTYQWYSCDADGRNTQPLQGETSSTLTIPNTTDVGVYYYRCKVTRQMLDGTTTDYWSSVASVQINKATDNYVTLVGTTVVFNNHAYSLSSVAAAKANSTFHYSADGGHTWSETAPVFTAVGAHTVWVYATNPNYEDTAVVTADVVIQERTGMLFKLQPYPIAALYHTYPLEVKALYPNADFLSDALITDMAATENIDKKDIEVYGVKLMFSMDNGLTWIEATSDNLPSTSMTVTLPYPAKTNRDDHNFILKQFVTDPLSSFKSAGDIRTLDITLDPSGIRFTADCLSVLVLGWNPRSTIANTGANVLVEKAGHGTVQTSHNRAVYGTEVTITVVPDNGYQLDSITIIDKNGNRVSYTANGNGAYTFKMPHTDVTVTSVFKADACNGTAADHCPSLAFTDLDTTQWYHLNVDYVLREGMMNGMGDGIFAPNGALSRAMLVTILWRLEDQPGVNYRMNFKDVPQNQWYNEAVRWAASVGIVEGYGDGTFGPNNDITREQLATILYRYEQYKGGGFVGTWMFHMDYADLADVSDWAYEAMCWMVMNEIVTGRPGKLLEPKGVATRAEAAAMLHRYCEKSENE